MSRFVMDLLRGTEMHWGMGADGSGRRLGSGRPAASRDLRSAVARASETKERAPWVDDLARQLEHELAP